MTENSIVEKEKTNVLPECRIKVIYGKDSLKNIVSGILENVFEKEINKNNI